MRKAGTNTKLSESWEGPFKVERKNSPLSYRVNLGDRILPSVHIQLLKEFVERQGDLKVSRVTSVLDQDTGEDSLEDRYAEAHVTGTAVNSSRAEDKAKWEAEFSDVLTKEPGLTTLTEFTMNTGDHPPISQRAYSTPTSLIDSVDKELQWLLDKQYKTIQKPVCIAHGNHAQT